MGSLIQDKFEAIGARAVFAARRTRWPRFGRRFTPDGTGLIELDIASDNDGEYFEIVADQQLFDLEVIDVQPRLRHLLLMARNRVNGNKEKFLCGHDERHWFVAAIPPGSTASVRSAMSALKPLEVRAAEARLQIPNRKRDRRRNAAFVRQGEWFFVPASGAVPKNAAILRNEPIRRGGGKPHIVEFIHRRGGETVRVNSAYPQGLTHGEYAALIERNPDARHGFWQVMVRGAAVFAKGRIRHPDHATITLSDWHRILMNTESNAPAMRHVAFLD